MSAPTFAARFPVIAPDDEPRHRAFLHVLAGGDPASRAWLEARAGLLVLRYIDAWSSGEWLPIQLLAERSAVATAIDELAADSQVHGLLSAILVRTTTEWALREGGEPFAHAPAPARTVPPLLAYAQALQFASEWALAADVYLTVWEACGPHARTPEGCLADIDAATTAALRLGACHRTLGNADRAAAAYAAAGALAQHHGDVHAQLSARLGEAKLVYERGNLPLADEQIAAVIRDAAAAQLADVRAHGLNDRAVIAYHRGHFREAIAWGFEAWNIERAPRERARVLADLANALLAAGYRDLARDANQLLAATAREPWSRWIATINLIEIATLEGDETEYHRCRRALRSVALPPALEAGYHYYAGLAEMAFGRPARACKALEQAVGLAEQNHLGELIIRADTALQDAQKGGADVARRPATPLPPDFAYVGDALHSAWAAASVED